MTAHRRDLPWRANRDPYRVWLSEIMLQQTRVAAVIEHYQEFLRRFPTIKKLAAAREGERAGGVERPGLLPPGAHAARRGESRSARVWREVSDDARRLARIAGDRTLHRCGDCQHRIRRACRCRRWQRRARVTASIGNAVDGRRAVASRYQPFRCQASGRFQSGDDGVGRGRVYAASAGVLDMPRGRTMRHARRNSPKTKPARQNKREIHYALDRRDGEVFLVRRPPDASLMPGMWELPELPTTNGGGSPSFTLRHSITITDYTVRVWHAASRPRVDGKWIPLGRMGQVALTGLAQKILRKAEML